MSRLEILDKDTIDAFLEAPHALLMLGKTTCEACKEWEAELTAYLDGEGADAFKDVRFGKLLVDQRGLIGFKRANPWLAEVDVLPYNLIYSGGELKKKFAGSGIERMSNRLERILG